MYKTQGAAVGQGWKEIASWELKHIPVKVHFRWWFQRFVIFTPTWGNDQIVLYFSHGLKPRTRFESMMLRTSQGWDMC